MMDVWIIECYALFLIMVYGVVRMFMYVNVMLSHIIIQLYYDCYSHPSAGYACYRIVQI